MSLSQPTVCRDRKTWKKYLSVPSDEFAAPVGLSDAEKSRAKLRCQYDPGVKGNEPDTGDESHNHGSHDRRSQAPGRFSSFTSTLSQSRYHGYSEPNTAGSSSAGDVAKSVTVHRPGVISSQTSAGSCPYPPTKAQGCDQCLNELASPQSDKTYTSCSDDSDEYSDGKSSLSYRNRRIDRGGNTLTSHHF